MGVAIIDRLTKMPEGMRVFQRQRTIQELGDLVHKLMDEQDMNHLGLAQRLDCTVKALMDILHGRIPMTVQDVSDILLSLDHAVHFEGTPVTANISPFLAVEMAKGMQEG